MSEERVIRINKVLRELNISLERAVDYLKDKGIAIEANPNAKISDKEFNILQNQFAGDKGNKEASKEVGEEKRKEKEALRVEREKEIDDKRKQDEERLRQQEVIKAKAVVTGPKQVGTIDLNPKKPTSAPIAQPIVDVKTDDFIGLTANIEDTNNATRLKQARLLGLTAVSREVSPIKPLPFDDMDAWAKLKANTGLTKIKVILGWLLNFRTMTIALPKNKIIA